jgi:hypothetical protein
MEFKRKPKTRRWIGGLGKPMFSRLVDAYLFAEKTSRGLSHFEFEIPQLPIIGC